MKLSMLPGSNSLSPGLGAVRVMSSLLPFSPYTARSTLPPPDGEESSQVFTDKLNSPPANQSGTIVVLYLVINNKMDYKMVLLSWSIRKTK